LKPQRSPAISVQSELGGREVAGPTYGNGNAYPAPGPQAGQSYHNYGHPVHQDSISSTDYRQKPAHLQDLHVPPASQQFSQYPVETPSAHAPEAFIDPAIVSYGKRPSTASATSDTTAIPGISPASIIQDPIAAFIQKSRNGPSQPEPKVQFQLDKHSATPASKPSTKASSAAATLTMPFQSLDLQADTETLDENEPLGIQVTTYTGKRSRRGEGKKKKDLISQAPLDPSEALGPLKTTATLDSSVEGHRALARKGKSSLKAFAETAETSIQRTPGLIIGSVGRKAASSSKRKNQRQKVSQDFDGWATEEATDIQDLGEFDFQGNLDKFDKRTVFKQLKAEDQILESDRLVYSNRLPAPRAGTAGGKNLHPTENVLGSNTGTGTWNSEAGETEEDEIDSDADTVEMRRTLSRQSTIRAPLKASSRKSSAAVGAGMVPLTSSSILVEKIGRTAHSSSNRSSHAGSPNRKAITTSTSIPPSSMPGLRITFSNVPCSAVSPLQMLDVERIAEVELGLTEDMMTENAGRGIAEVALSALNPGGRRIARENHNASPVLVILAGNNKNGARAIAAGRHLRNHAMRVLIVVLGLERENELLENVRRQLKIFRQCGGKLTNFHDLASNLKSFEALPELVVDALLGMHVAFDDLRTDDQATTYELIKWANKARAPVLAVDVPTGIDGTSGAITLVDSVPLFINAKFVVSMGAPKAGILHALTLAPAEAQSWQIFVADIGISNTAWRKYGTRRRHGVEFGSAWVVALRFHAGNERRDS
jgi:enhancer of mRNA-decapping protein 3